MVCGDFEVTWNLLIHLFSLAPFCDTPFYRRHTWEHSPRHYSQTLSGPSFCTPLHFHLLTWLDCSRNLRSSPATALQPYGQGWWGFSSVFVSHGGEWIPCFHLCARSTSHILWWLESACCPSHPLHHDLPFLLPRICFRRRPVFLQSKSLI